jgi:hypothetical protein
VRVCMEGMEDVLNKYRREESPPWVDIKGGFIINHWISVEFSH